MKKVAYKIKKQLGGSVVFKNLKDVADKDAAKIGKLMESYGFCEEDDDLWGDFLKPEPPDAADISQIATYVPIEVKTSLSAKGKPRFQVSFDKSEASVGSDLTDTVAKAHKKWNQGGRPLHGMPLEEALTKEVDRINKGLGL